MSPKIQSPMDPDEDITLQWISLDEAQDMLDHGAIMDAKTIIALQHKCQTI